MWPAKETTNANYPRGGLPDGGQEQGSQCFWKGLNREGECWQRKLASIIFVFFLAEPRKGDSFSLSTRLNFYEIIHGFPFASVESTQNVQASNKASENRGKAVI